MKLEIQRIHFSTISSTNQWAKERFHSLDRDRLTLITAACQTQGKGRLGRQWVSPPEENLYASFCIFLPKGTPCLHSLSQVMAVSAAKTLEQLGFFPRLKWPNDLMINHKKISGILTEIEERDGLFLTIIGIGINVNMRQSTIEKIDQPATSLLIEGGAKVEIETVIDLLSHHFTRDLDLFLKEGSFAPFLNHYQKRLSHKFGDFLEFQNGKEIWKGKFHAISPDGALSLELPSGEVKKIFSGEIVL